MAYLLLASAVIYLVLVEACHGNPKYDGCLKGLRTFISVMALIATVNLLTGWDQFPPAAATNRAPQIGQLSALQAPAADLLPSKNEIPENSVETVNSQSPGSRPGSFFLRENRDHQGTLINSPEHTRLSQIHHHEERMRIAARTAMLGILLRQVGK